jgi:hypothetical protein
MAIAVRRAQTTWEGPLASGAGVIPTGSGAAGELPVTWAARTDRADGKTSPEELAAAAHSACTNRSSATIGCVSGAGTMRMSSGALLAVCRCQETVCR